MSRITELNFSDLYYTPEHIAYIPDKRLNGALIVVEPDDLREYVQALESCYTGSVSYSMV